MNRRAFFGTLAGAIVAVPVVASAQTSESFQLFCNGQPVMPEAVIGPFYPYSNLVTSRFSFRVAVDDQLTCRFQAFDREIYRLQAKARAVP